ncbi:hypothetical protein E1265_20075 [Streptomyces sp. 8K308]|uniref:hypothetical protein n=1 Tax=Streptomyces sp. 8K308 TaxID=2530388 RepID=UPI001044657C|nr:hypothetical protein [Streptomyces sp. 8K308]TDC20861.1 hypothetical protein E1265_20075 [Streptomyces sp. 8K308]
MGEFERYTHEQLAGLLASADPEQLTARADVLLAMARGLNGADKQVLVQMSQVEWQGENAKAFRAWGRHLVQESATLADYARTVGNALQDAGQALSEARAAMPPTPERPAPVSETAIASVSEELERQEAIHVLERLSSSYRAAADDMAGAQEPRFRPVMLEDFEGGKETRSPSQSSAPVEPSSWKDQSPVNAASREIASSEGRETSPTQQVGLPSAGERATEVATPPLAVIDEPMSTSLDSTAPVLEPRLPAAETATPVARLNPAIDGGDEFVDRAPQPGTVGPLPQRRNLSDGPLTGPRSPSVGQPPVVPGAEVRGFPACPCGGRVARLDPRSRLHRAVVTGRRLAVRRCRALWGP